MCKQLGLPLDYIGTKQFTFNLRKICNLTYKRNSYSKPEMEDNVTIE